MESDQQRAIIRDKIVAAYQSGTFLQTVYEMTLADYGERDDALSAELAALHNEGVIDVIAGFSALGETGGGPDFFLTKHVFEKALPMIKAPVVPLMKCVLCLYKRAGKDLTAGAVVNAFVDFCDKDSSRPEEALATIREDEQLFDLLTATIVAGTRLDCPRYSEEAVRLAEHADIQVRRRAVYALGRIVWPDSFPPPESVYASLEQRVATEHDDELLAFATKSCFSIMLRDPSQSSRVIEMMDKALSKGADHTIHAASEIVFFHTKELTGDVIEMLVPHLLRVNPANKGTLDNIDYFLSRMLKKGSIDKAIEITEKILLANAGDLSMSVFDSLMADILRDKKLLARVTTRWFLNSEYVLCKGIESMAKKVFGSNIEVEADLNELDPVTPTRLVFVARKAIAYLFFSPMSSSSFLISLMRLTNDDNTLDELGNYLFEHLLVNYSGTTREYVAKIADTDSGKVKNQLERSLGLLDAYLDGLRSTGELPEFDPTAGQRETHYRRHAQKMAESYKQAEAQSPLLKIINKSVLLYGRKSINYIYDQKGERQRTEMPLKSHSVTFEPPRKEMLDPFGLDYTIRVFRMERLRE